MKPQGSWSFDQCAEDASKYKTRTSWRAASSGAYTFAYRRGWLAQCCSHMTSRQVPKGHWTKERCREDAEKHGSRSEWNRNSSGAYDAAMRNGWLEECCANLPELKKPDGYWTIERCLARALDFSTIADWQRGCPSSFDASRYNGAYDSCVAHMRQRRRRGSITEEQCRAHALQYGSRSDWKAASTAMYLFAKAAGIFDDVTSHVDYDRSPPGYWTKELCAEMAAPFKSRKAWSNGHPKSYDAARVSGWLDEIAAGAGMLRFTRDTAQREFAATCRELIAGTDIELREEVGKLAGQRTKVDMVFYRTNVPFLAVEYIGPYWHSEARGKDKNYHRDRMNALRSKGIRLITVYEKDKDNPIVLGMIRSALGLPLHKVRATKCTVVMVGDIVAREFYLASHIDGGWSAGKDQINIGLEIDGRLISCMTFVRSTDRYTGGGNYDWCLHRFATEPGYLVHGAASRLFKRFRSFYPETSVVALCDLQLFSGSLYRKLGFTLARENPPDYGWTKATTTLDRRETSKRHLPDLLGCGYDPSLAEPENMERAGYSKIWDCGKAVYALVP